MNIGSRALFAGAPAQAVRVLGLEVAAEPESADGLTWEHRARAAPREFVHGDWAPLREVHPQVIELDTSGL
ncbi:hypothetical protein [Streptomyces nojiriensis]|uniref:hypothetical protein n=1 Tax=Streptomyces nojiriensis TaxID=66374 RepID=UPI0035DF84B0